jgi:hypothetical protein
MALLSLILLLLAALCFIAAASGAAVSRFNLVALGLVFWVLVPLIGAVHGLGY